jgi:hypothetical protein
VQKIAKVTIMPGSRWTYLWTYSRENHKISSQNAFFNPTNIHRDEALWKYTAKILLQNLHNPLSDLHETLQKGPNFSEDHVQRDDANGSENFLHTLCSIFAMFPHLSQSIMLGSQWTYLLTWFRVNYKIFLQKGFFNPTYICKAKALVKYSG